MPCLLPWNECTGDGQTTPEDGDLYVSAARLHQIHLEDAGAFMDTCGNSLPLFAIDPPPP